MKRLSHIYLVFILPFWLLVDTGAYADAEIFACEPEWAALAKELGKKKVTVYTAIKPGEDPHDVEARPSLIGRLKNADLLFCSGAGLEQNWLPKILAKAGNDKIKSGKPGNLMAAEAVELLEADGRHQGSNHEAGNPHIHLDPNNITKVAEQLTSRLKQIDAANAGFYQANTDRFLQHWQKAINLWERQAQPLKDVAIVVNHENWAYLNDWLNLRQVTALESKPGIAPSSAYLAGVLTAIRSLPTQMIITSAHQDPRAVKWLADKTGLPIVILPYTVGANAQAKDLFGLFDAIIEALLVNAQ